MTKWKDLQHHGRQMTLEKRIAAPADAVYEAWADPERIAHWFVDRARGRARVGETVTWSFEKFGLDLPYHVQDAVPGERLALGGQLPDRPPFLLEVRLRRDGGETVLTLVNSGFLDGASWNEEYEGVASGWALALVLLKEYVERHFGQAKSTLLVVRPAAYTYDRLFPFFTTTDGLTSWLAASGAVAGPGQPYSLRLADGSTMSGRQLWATRREVAYSWSELDAVIELKAFATGPETRVVGVRVTGWGPEAGRVNAFEPAFAAALDRLVDRVADTLPAD